ncbi:hypothetical protein JQS43_11270 [Natronosporangium hydrolyticum]|uniref:Uncharacterized protein n=1 Tax=Natronosporangium hydrolyticum TaxID=2811111 RepID=A0A895YPZ4_9ACTN|nr:hypothetical protein [Natronosporangium hydrolyticum]QSB16806.1 hypothetical protein JQS43_11270 [Natronosporangium hydrolyticum]
MPDDWLAYTRQMLATGDLAYLPDTIAGSVLELGVSLTPAEVAFLPQVLSAIGHGDDQPPGLASVRVSEETPPTGHRFYPTPPHVLAAAGDRIPTSLDLTGGESKQLWDLPPELARLTDLADDLTDMADNGIAVVLSRRAGVIGIWRAWRFEPTGPPSGGRRVYLVEVEPGVPAWKIANDGQRELADDGEEHPQVEVYWSGEELTAYHRAARAGSALLWARHPGRVRVAPTPSEFAAEHPRLTDPQERDLLVSRLHAGAVVGGTLGRGTDVVEPARGTVVPLTRRTDGHWVWSESTAYYLAEHGLAPQPALANHLRLGPPASFVDGVGLFRAEDTLRSEGR